MILYRNSPMWPPLDLSVVIQLEQYITREKHNYLSFCACGCVWKKWNFNAKKKVKDQQDFRLKKKKSTKLMCLSPVFGIFLFLLFCSFIPILRGSLTHARTHARTHAHTHTHTHNTGMHNAHILFFSPSRGICSFVFLHLLEVLLFDCPFCLIPGRPEKGFYHHEGQETWRYRKSAIPQRWLLIRVPYTKRSFARAIVGVPLD